MAFAATPFGKNREIKRERVNSFPRAWPLPHSALANPCRLPAPDRAHSGGFFACPMVFFAALLATVVFSKECENVATGIVKWFNATKGVWVYSARQRRQGRVCAYLGSRESGPQQPQ